MRDIAVLLVFVVGCIYTIKKPYVGVLVWSWLSYMNPHRLCWGFAYNLPLAYANALLLLSVLPFSKETQRVPINSIVVVWVSFVLFMGLTTLFAFFSDYAMLQYIKVIKIQLIVFITMMLITDLKKLNELIWVIVLSIGYFTIKGGVFTIKTGGGFRVWGPPESFIEGNNELAVAALMVIPLMAYLYRISQQMWVKRFLLFGIAMTFASALGSQSRGALLAFLTVVAFFWMKSDKKVVIGVVMMFFTFVLLLFMPRSWYERMETINNYEQDESAMGRINAWHYAINSASDNWLGMGFDSWSPQTFALYAPNPADWHAAHSIYFSVLADHGWIGLIMFITIFWLCWKTLKKVIVLTKDDPINADINFLTRMVQVSFIAYFSGGAFLSLAYFDLPWHLASFTVIIKRIVDTQLASKNFDNIRHRNVAGQKPVRKMIV